MKGHEMSYVYSLRDDFKDKSQIGNKGANLVSMIQLGLPVPPGFIVPVKAYEKWRDDGLLPETEIQKALAAL